MRYDRNGIFTDRDMTKLKEARVGVVGCGGLGGYILEMLARVGVGHLTLIDGDCFNLSNLNRQLLSREDNMGRMKVAIARERIQSINSEVGVAAYAEYLDEKNATTLLKNHDLVMDALDSIPSRYVLQEACEELGVPLIHGAIGGWYGQVAVIYPGDRTLDLLYRQTTEPSEAKGIEAVLGNPSFTPATIASLQVSEGLKVLLNRGKVLRHQVLYVDLLEDEFHILNV